MELALQGLIAATAALSPSPSRQMKASVDPRPSRNPVRRDRKRCGALQTCSSSRPRFALAPLALLWIALLATLLAGCSSDSMPDPWVGDGTPWGGAPVGGPCSDGAEAVCGKKLSQQNGVVACLEGKQYCIGGTWSECLGDDVTYRPDPRSEAHRNFFGRLRTMPYLPPESTPAPCDNPCDPYCYFFDEDPTDIEAPGGTPAPPVPEFPGGPGVQACDHDLCSTGSALYSTCSPCAAQVCAAEPSCCTTSWSASCVSRAYSLCTTQRPPLSLCELGLFADTTIVVRNRATADAVLGSYGNVTIDTDGAVAGIYSKGNITYQSLNGAAVNAPYGIVADGNITSQDSNSNVNAFLEAGGSIFIPSWDVTQSVSAGTTLTGQNSTTILGNARANGGISNVSSIGGTTCSTAGCYTHRPVELPPQTAGTAIPTLPVNCTGTTDFSSNGGTATVSGPGVYRNVSVINNGRLVLEGEGVYYFNNFAVTDRIEFRRTATNTGAGWDIRTCGTVSFGNNTRFIGSTAGGVTPALVLDGTNSVLMDPSLVTFYVNTSTTVTMGTSVYFTGIFIAPNATVQKANMNTPPTRAQVLAGTRSAPINGAIWARQLDIGTDALTKQIPREACEDLGIPGTTPPGMCPISNVTAPVPAAIDEPCGSGLDCQINHHCVGPETGATCAHSKCMPGVALSASCDTCVARICAQDPTCCSGSWTASCVEKVATVCDATCNDYSCYAPNLCAPQAEPVEASCSTCVASICAVDPSCCTTSWTQACADRVYTVCGSGLPTARSPSICDYAGYAGGATTVQGSGVAQRARVLGGDLGGAGLGSMTVQYADVTGTVYNAGSVSTYYTAISGNLVWGSGANSIVAPTTYNALIQGNPPQPARPTRTPSCPGGATPTSGSIPPGNYGAVTVPNGSTLTLSAGTYTFTSLSIGTAAGATPSDYATLAVPASGRVTINVCGAVGVRSFSRVTGLTASTALNLDIYATGSIALNSHTTVYGLLNSNTNIGLEPGATLYGLAWSGSSLGVLGDGATIDATGLGESCRSIHDPSATALRTDRLCGYAAYGRTGVSLSGSTQVSGGALGSGAALTVADGSRLHMDVLSVGNVTKGSTSAYFQNLKSRGTITGTAPVYGTEAGGLSAAAVPAPDWPTVSFACTSGRPPGGVDQNLWGTTLPPGTYGNVALNGDWQTLTLQAGDYYVGNLDLTRANTTLTLPATGTVRIFACGQVTFGPGLTLNNSGTGANIGRFRVYSLSAASADTSPAIYVNNGSGRFMRGVFVAPNGKISVGASSTLQGVAWGNAVWTNTSGIINGGGYAGSNCAAANIDAAPVCPVTVAGTPPSEPGECHENVLGYTDATCSTYDLAAGVPCEDRIPVCNHGTSTFNGNLTLGYWAADQGQMSREMPTRSPQGTCSASGLSIAPGNCVEVTCALPSTDTHTLVIDPNNVLSECGSGYFHRRLDNWTVHDGRSCSAGGGPPVEVEYLYEAECPYDSSARWGFLTWNTTTPGTSSISFAAQVALSAADLTSAGYVDVGVAQSSPTDTSVCTLSGPNPACPVHLSDALNLGFNQGQFLALRILLQPTADTPVLRDWDVTYTCVYDE